ncbi:MAG: hypothetical protein ABIP97_05665 [Chthoniobacterales bacterium]
MVLAIVGQHVFKSRSHKYYEEASERANHGDWKGAADKAASAANLDTKNIAALRLAVLTAMRSNDKPLPGLTDRLFKDSETAHDRYISLRADAGALDWQAYDKKLSALSSAERRSEVVSQLEVYNLSQRNRKSDAITLARRSHKQNGGRKMAFILATLLMDVKPRPDAEIASLLAEVVQQDGGAEALAALPLIQNLNPEIVRQSKIHQGLSEMVAAMPKAKTTDFLIALEIERVRSPKKFDALVDQAVDWNAEHPSPEVFRWLLTAGQVQKAVNAYSSSTFAQKSADYDGVRVALMLNKSDYTAARQIIESSKLYEDSQRDVLLAAIASAGGMPDEQALWDKAFADAAKDGTGHTAQQIARSARFVKRDTIRKRALLLAAASGDKQNFSRRDALEALGELVKQRNTKLALVLVNDYFKNHPDDPDFANNALYLALLMHTAPPDVMARLEKLRREYPEQTGLRSTLALAYLRHEKTKEAVALLSGITLSNAAMAVNAAALHAAGHKEEAQSVAGKIDRSSLLPEEEALLHGL